MMPRPIRDDMSEPQKMSSAMAYGDRRARLPVDRDLGLHIIESLMDQDFDVAQTQYLKAEYGGSIGPATWYLDMKRRPSRAASACRTPSPSRSCAGSTARRPPIVPITINTCYPPNWISPRRAYALGQAVRKAVEDGTPTRTSPSHCSGGLSHFVVDEELDRIALKGLRAADGEHPDHAAAPPPAVGHDRDPELGRDAGAMGGTKMEVITYEPGYRTPAGTGCGCAVGHWHD